MTLDITPERLTEICRELYGPTQYAHAPAQLLLDSAWGRVTYLRCSFPEKFTHAAAAKLDQLRRILKDRYGPAYIVFVVYFETIDVKEAARRSLALADR